MCAYLVLVLVHFTTAQMESGGIPETMPGLVTNEIPIYDLPPADYSEIGARELEISRQSAKIEMFALNYDVEINSQTNGKWIEVNGLNIWLLQIKSDGAKSLGFVMENFNLKQGEKLFIYNKNEVIGAFTKFNNTVKKILATRFLPGEIATIEFSTPYSKEKSGTFTFTGIMHNYKSNLTSTPSKCYININCKEGADWQEEKRAVCKIIVNGIKCTGTLINNTKQDAIPYLLTANHCISSDFFAERSTFYFNYESPTCEATSGYNGHALSGASVSSTLYQNDFTLLKLLNHPPMSFVPYYCGWSLDSMENIDVVRIIHHPGGDIKKISGSNEHPTTATFVEVGEPSYSKDGFWLVHRYDLGITEGGSSGGALLDKNHRIIGTLTAGDNSDTSCFSVLYDYYSKFSYSYRVEPNIGLKMSSLLNPDNLNITNLDGFDPFPHPVIGCDTLSNILASENKAVIAFENGTGYYSGHNSDSITQFAEKFEYPDSTYLYGAYFNVKNSDTKGSVIFQVFSGTEKPEKLLYEKFVSLQNIYANSLNYIEFYPNVQLKGNYFIGYRITYEKSDTFSVYMAEKRLNNINSSAFLNVNASWINIKEITSNNWGSAFDIRPVYCTSFVNELKPIQTAMAHVPSVFPNPSHGIFRITFKDEDLIKFKIFNILGKMITPFIEKDGKNYLVNLYNYPAGIYVINVSTNAGSFYTLKLIKE